MLVKFLIITTSGILLWSKKYAPVNPSVVNSFISDVLIEERVQPGTDGKYYKKDSYMLKWTTANDFGLIFIAVYQSLLQLTWIDELLDTVKKLFTTLYGEQLKKPHTATIECHFDDYFNSRISELERKAGGPRPIISAPVIEQAKDDGKWDAPPPPPIPGILKAPPRPGSPAIANSALMRPGTPESRSKSPAPASHLLAGTRRPARGRRGGNSAHASSGEEKSPARNSKKGGKKLRKWDADGNADEEDGAVLDYSAPGVSTDEDTDHGSRKMDYIEQKEWGTKTSKGEFVLKDLDMEVNQILKEAEEKDRASNTASSGYGAFGFFRNIVGGKTLTKADLEKAMTAMQEHLSKKNVAREAAVQVTESVEKSLIGQKTGSFQSIEATVKAAVEASLRKILTPTNSLDLLREIQTKRSGSSKRPYVISIVGVNGVGKSTNLSKICFFLLQNKFKVLIAACDTFRSGAVEQLRVHARNLKELSEREGGVVELYEKGYGKDAANIAKDAVAFGEAEGFDVVLIDTAGRRHNDQRLMSSLEKFAKFAEPDKILMVGEALVGTDSVQQARNFNAAFGNARTLDGFIISKCDTVGDMIGTLISMVFATGIPVVFLGTGQNYQDLRTLNIAWAVKLLMS
ncbi:P-loop containing nucleoside triphosphate hydrolase protein [Morchella conica CCBAS932]|uniref:Signal recognition particle receptor subunit alpha homolog n=1 Tax=Morchella conica CCBAS932 TaxID=1392247 RepID=A0A3N4KDX0_9PEZI|nr:P-loop containing nucleoside triphosphate hydrolase protein [Morchella conica CCBAS932]